MTREMRDYVKGLILGRFSSPLPSTPAKKEPVAYLYNGVRLPNIDSVWTGEYKDEQPYAILAYTSSNVRLITFSSYEFFDDEGTWKIRYTNYTRTTYIDDSDSWGQYGSGGYGEDRTTSQRVEIIGWANFDILNTDGSIYLAASEPIPVYE